LSRQVATGRRSNRELFQHSAPTVEKVVGAILTESAGLQLDACLSDASPSTTTRPAGLRYGVAATAASATTGNEGMIADITALASAVAPVAGNNSIVLVAAPKTATSLRLRKLPDFPFEILASSALTAGTVIAVAANALASAVDPSPKISSSIEAVLVFDDAAPAQVGVGVKSGTVQAGSLCDLYPRVHRPWAGADFNSLDAQHDAAQAYIRSQAHAGWILIRARYDDGGYSGGSTDRPALQRLLSDVKAGKIDVIVVYKVDRLTRSLADFAKLVELFDGSCLGHVRVQPRR
jgi:Resolvase, N terminal domain